MVKTLPFTVEGYKSKVHLKDRFEKYSEIKKAFVKEILELSHVSSVSRKKIGDYLFKKLVISVQALATVK